MRILFTSVGRRVELVQVFKEAAKKLNVDLEVYGVDIVYDAPALSFCDKKKLICRIDDPKYIDTLLELCREEKIDCVIPTIDTDLLILAENKNRFAEVGTFVLISSPENIKICRDKNNTYKFFKRCGLQAPETFDDVEKYHSGYPAFIKPKDGSSAKDAYRVNSYSELSELSVKVKNYVVQPYIDGREYTVDIFCDFSGSPIFITPRQRLLIRSGEVIKTKVDLDSKIIQEILNILAEFKPIGPITVQLIREKITERDYFIEINPRFGGGSPLSMKAGANSAEALLKLLRGERVEFVTDAADNGAVYSRYDQSIRVA